MAKEKESLSPGEAIQRHAERATGEPLKVGDAVVSLNDGKGFVTVANPRSADWQAPEPTPAK